MNMQKIAKHLRGRGKKLAAANKACKGTTNKNGEFYRCVKRMLKTEAK
jgi:hypothetical protein